MEMIALILSGLALLAASVCLVMIHQEKKRSTKRNAALVRFVEKEAKAVSTAAGSYVDENMKKCIERMEIFTLHLFSCLQNSMVWHM